MAAKSPIVLIFGAGTNIGQSVASAFAAKGYKLALVARRLKESDSTADQVHIRGDLSDPSSVATAFSKAKTALGDVPSVVVYNAASVHVTPKEDPLSIKLEDFTQSLAINTASAYAAAQQAQRAFETLPESASRTFIYTGNILNTTVMTNLLDLGVGKSATAHLIEVASVAYKDKGFKFYYADQRQPDGGPSYQVDGPAHGEHFVKLAEDASQGPWLQTFVKGVGYKQF